MLSQRGFIPLTYIILGIILLTLTGGIIYYLHTNTNKSQQSAITSLDSEPSLEPTPTDSPFPTDTPTPSDGNVDGISTDEPTVTEAPLPTAIPQGPTANLTNSTLSANSVPADGSSKATVIVTLKDGSGNLLPGQAVSLSTLDGTVNFYPSSVVTNSSGQAAFTATSYSSTAEEVNAEVSANGTSTPLADLGTITFNSLGSSTSSTCTNTGVPTAFNSEAIVSTVSNGSATITIELFDCNNAYAPVSDTLTLSSDTTDSNLLVNGTTPSVTIQAQNGQATFTVSSSSTQTDTFTIEDTTQSFNVTDPNNNNPSVTFNGSTPSPTPTPTPSPTASPTPTPSPTPSATP